MFIAPLGFFAGESENTSNLEALVRTDLNRYFHFNGDLNDYSTNNNHATMAVGTATYTTDKWNQKAFLPQDNAVVDSGHPMISTDTTYTIAAWVYSDVAHNDALLCSNSHHYVTWGPGGIYLNFGGSANATGFHYRYSNSNVTAYTCATPSLSTGAWHHVVAVQNGSTMQIWVDGSKETEITNATNAPFNTSNNMIIGGIKSNQGGDGGWRFEATNMKIDEFAYWTKSLTQAEIEYLWNSGNGRHIYPPASTIEASVTVTSSTVNITATIGDPAGNAAGGWAYSTSALGAVGQPHGGTAVPSGNTAQITGAAAGSYTLHYALIDGSGNVVVKDSTTYSVGSTTPAFDKFGYYPLYSTASDANAATEGNGSHHTHVFGGVTYYMPNGISGGPGGGNQFHGTYGQVAGYNFDSGNANDSIGSNNGTASNVTFVTAGGRTYADFSGSSSKITLSSDPFTASNATFTMSMWVKHDSLSGAQRYISWGSSGGRFFFGYNSSQNRVDLGMGATTTIVSSATYRPTVNVWELWTVSNSGTTTKFYKNGELVSTVTHGDTGAINSGQEVKIGAQYSSNGEHLDGKMDDVRIWSRVLPDDEVANLYSSTQPLEEGMVAKYRLDYDATDSVGTANGTVAGATFTATGNKRESVFDGSNDYIQIPHDASNAFGTGDFAISMWINPDVVAFGGSNQGTLWSKDYSNLELYIYDSKVNAYMGGAGNVITGGSVSTGAWQHVVLTRTGTTTKMYINGSDNSSVAAGNPGSANLSGTNNAVYLGYRNGNSNSWYDGKMDDIRHWSRGLTSAEVSSLYSAGREDYSSSVGLTAHYSLDSDASATVGSDGTNSGATFSTVGSYKFASFDGSNDSIELPHDANQGFGGNTVSVSTWIKTTSTQNDTIWLKGYGGSGGDSLFTMEINNGSNANKARLFWRNSAAGGSGTCISTTSVNDGNWHHLLAVRDGSTLKLYVDGSLEDTATGLSGNFTGHLFYLGKWDHQSYSAQNFYTGDIDELKVWNRAFTADEATHIYNQGHDAY